MRLLSEIRFGAGGNSQPYILHGMGHPEAGFTWTIGTRTRLGWKAPSDFNPSHVLLIEFDLAPFVVVDALPRQTLKVYVQDTLIGQRVLDRHNSVSFTFLNQITPGATLYIDLHHDDARRPIEVGHGKDTRQLGFALHYVRIFAALALPPAKRASAPALDSAPSYEARMDQIEILCGVSISELVWNFQTIGSCCEFSAVQRRVGGVPRQLLHFSLSLFHLIDGLPQFFASPQHPGLAKDWDMTDDICWLKQHAPIWIHGFLYEGAGIGITVQAESPDPAAPTRPLPQPADFLQHLRNGDRVHIL